MKSPEERIQEALEIARRGGGDDGEAHHLLWMIDQMVQTLLGDKKTYDDWIKETCSGENGPGTYEWDTGVAP